MEEAKQTIQDLKDKITKSPKASRSNSKARDTPVDKSSDTDQNNDLHDMPDNTFDNSITHNLPDNHIVTKTRHHPLGDLVLSVLNHSKKEISPTDIVGICEKFMKYVSISTTQTEQSKNNILESVKQDKLSLIHI